MYDIRPVGPRHRHGNQVTPRRNKQQPTNVDILVNNDDVVVIVSVGFNDSLLAPFAMHILGTLDGTDMEGHISQ